MTTGATEKPNTAMVRVELSYCPRCGTLRALTEGSAAEDCAVCVRCLAWVRAGCKRPRRRSPRPSESTKGDQS